MVYVYKKVIGKKTYYYLRASERKGKRIISKDIAYLGTSLHQVRKSLAKRPTKEIRAAYKTIHRFLESNTYLEQVKKLKTKHSPYMSKEILMEVEACRLHWQKSFLKRDEKTRQDYLKNFVIDFVFNTTSLEGNTITLKETAKLLSEQRTPEGKTLREIYDLQNTEKVFFEVFKKQRPPTHEHIIEIHKELMRNIDERIGYRTHDVRVIRARFKVTPYPYIRADMDILFKLHNQSKKKLHPLVLAGIFHHKFEKIHPFAEGNGRTGRILLNETLLSRHYPPIIIRKRSRKIYLNALAKADRSAIDQTEPEAYNKLIEFLAAEYVTNYWNNFL